MGSSHSQVPYLSSDLREWLATTVEAHADEILQEWLGEAEEILREGNWQPLHVFRSRLEAEGRFALRALAARLRSNLNGPQTALERASIRLLAGNVPEGAERDSKLTTAFSLYYSFSDCLVRAVALHLPDYVSGKEALILRAALLIALRRVVDIAPCRFVARVEERLRGQQRQLAQVYKRLLMAQEDERRRIARDVHDVLAQGLAAARYRTETAARLLRAGHVDAAEGELQEVAQLIDYTLQHVRDIIFDLRPATLDRFGLRTALDDYAARIRGEAGPQITVRGSGDPKVLSEEQQLGLFRIAQEALWNAVRHSGASRAEVVLDVYDNETRLVVRDNGRGFDVDAVLSQENPRHYGLLGMRERAELIGGRFEVHSEIGRGTQVVVSVPIRGTPHEGDTDASSISG